MTLFGHLLGGAAFGFGVRCYSLGLQLKPIFSAPSGHIGYSVIGMGVGFFLHGVQERQEAVIEKRRARLQARKEQRMLESN